MHKNKQKQERKNTKKGESNKRLGLGFMGNNGSRVLGMRVYGCEVRKTYPGLTGDAEPHGEVPKLCASRVCEAEIKVWGLLSKQSNKRYSDIYLKYYSDYSYTCPPAYLDPR